MRDASRFALHLAFALAYSTLTAASVLYASICGWDAGTATLVAWFGIPASISTYLLIRRVIRKAAQLVRVMKLEEPRLVAARAKQ